MIAEKTPKVVYIGDGTTVKFPFTFAFADKTDIKVSLYNIASGSTTVLTKDYYVDDEAKTVAYPGYTPGEEPAASDRPAVLTSDYKIIIYRETAVAQINDLGKKYPLPIIETMIDRTTMIEQEKEEKLERCVMTSMGSDMTPEEIITTLNANTATAIASASAAAASQAASKLSEENAKTSETSAASSAKAVEQVRSDIDIAAKFLGTRATVYDATKSYTLADVVMMPDGSTYRCLENSPAGENPVTSSKWALVVSTIADTFERDENGDLMPRLHPQTSSMWQIDTDENIMPMEVI